MKKNLLIGIGIVCFAGILGVAGWFFLKSNSSRDEVIQNAGFDSMPEFNLPDLSAKLHTPKEFGGKLTIIHFWASWCTPCEKEFPSLISLATTKVTNIQVVAISLDHSKEEMQSFIGRQKSLPANFLILQDPKGISSKTFGVHRLPETFIFDKDKNLLQKFERAENWLSQKRFKDVVTWLNN